MKRTVVLGGLLVVLVALGIAGAGSVGGTSGASGTVADETGPENNASFGAEVSSFMQASSAETEGEVDDRMFGAALNRTEDPEERRALIEQRQERLQERHDRLTAQRAEISSDDPSVRDHAIATRVSVGATTLEGLIDRTERAAERTGLDTTRLEQLRTNVSQLRGPEIAEIAHALVDPLGDSDRDPLSGPPGANGSDDRAAEPSATNQRDEQSSDRSENASSTTPDPEDDEASDRP